MLMKVISSAIRPRDRLGQAQVGVPCQGAQPEHLGLVLGQARIHLRVQPDDVFLTVTRIHAEHGRALGGQVAHARHVDGVIFQRLDAQLAQAQDLSAEGEFVVGFHDII